MFSSINFIKVNRNKIKNLIDNDNFYCNSLFKDYVKQIHNLTTELTVMNARQGSPDDGKQKRKVEIRFLCTDKGKDIIEQAYLDSSSKFDQIGLWGSCLKIIVRKKPICVFEEVEEEYIRTLVLEHTGDFENEKSRENFIVIFLETLILLLKK